MRSENCYDSAWDTAIDGILQSWSHSSMHRLIVCASICWRCLFNSIFFSALILFTICSNYPVPLTRRICQIDSNAVKQIDYDSWSSNKPRTRLWHVYGVVRNKYERCFESASLALSMACNNIFRHFEFRYIWLEWIVWFWRCLVALLIDFCVNDILFLHYSISLY